MRTWTPERVSLLTSLWADGMPGWGDRQADGGMTRGMVAGKRHSLGLPPRTASQIAEAEHLNAWRTSAMFAPIRAADPAKAAHRAAAAERVEKLERLCSPPLPGSSPRPLEFRNAGECKFPVSGYGGGTLSCCEVTDDGQRYCFGHNEILAGRYWPPIDAEPELSQWADA